MKEIKNQENEKSTTCEGQKAGEYDTDFDEKLSEQPNKNSAKTLADDEEVAKKAKKAKKKINWKHFLCYLCTYILVAAVVGFVIVKITPPAKSPTNYAGSINNTDDAGDDSILGQMVTNLMTMTDANLTLNLSAQTDEQRVAISAEIGAVIYPEFSGADASIKGDVWVNGKEFPFEFAYKGGVIFASVAGAQVQIKTDKLVDGVKLILSLAGVNMGLSDGIASSLDPMALMAIVQENLTEEEVEGGFKLTYKIDEAAAAKVFIDENYNIKSVAIDDFTAGGANINLGLVFDKINSKYAVSAPAGEYLDVSETFGIVEALINSVKEKQVEATFAFGGVSAKLNLDRAGELKTRADLSFAGKNIVLTETERRTYISSEYANLSFDNFSRESVKEIMAAVLGLVESETGFDKASVPQSFEDIKAFAGEFDFNAIIKFLGAFKFSAITKTNTGFEIKTNLFNLILVVENEKVSSVRVKDGEFDFKLNLAYGKAVDINEDDFEYVGDINGLKAPIVNLLQDKNLKNNYQNILNAIKTVAASTGLNRADVEARVEFGEFAFDVNLVIIKGDALLVAFETEFKGERIWGYIKDDAVYINALDVCLKVNLQDVLIGELDKLDDLKNFNVSEIEEKIKAFDIAAFIRDFDTSKYLEKFGLSLNENELAFVGFGVSARVDLTQNTLSNIAISGEIDSVKFSANLVLSETDTDIEMTNNEIVKTGLTRGFINHIINLLNAKIEGGEVDNAKALSQIIINTSKQTNFGVGGAFNGLGFALDFDIQNGIKARVNLNIDGQTIAVMVIGETVYIESEYACAKFNILSKENLKRIYLSVMAIIESETGKKIDIEAIKQNAQNVKLADVLRRAFGTLPDILSELDNAHIARTGDVFKLTCSLGTLTIETDGTLVTKISVESEKINQAFSINYGNEISVDEAKFVNLGDSNEMADALVGVLESDNLKPTIENILSLVKKIKASLDTNCIDARVTTSLMGETIAVNIRVVLRDELFVSFATEIKGINIYGFVEGKTLYINMFDVCLKLDLAEIAGSEINKLDGAFSLDKREVLNKLKALDLNEIISKINIKEILSKLKLNLTSNLLSTSFNGLDIVVDLSGERIKNLTCAGSVNGIEFNAGVTLSRFDGACDMNNLRVIELKNVKEIAEAAINSLKNKSVSGRVDINFDFGGETNLISAEYGAKFDGEIKGFFKTTFKGLGVEIYLLGETVYLDIFGTCVKVSKAEMPALIAWVNDMFGLNLSDEIFKKQFKLADISLKDIAGVDFNSGALKINIVGGGTLSADYGKTFTGARFNARGIDVNLAVSNFDDFNFDAIDFGAFMPYTQVTNFIDAVMATVNARKYDLSGAAQVKRNGGDYLNADIRLILENVNKFMANGSAIVSGNTNLTVTAAYLNDFLYANVGGLKVKIAQNNLFEILVIACDLVGVDPDSISFLKDFTGDRVDSSTIAGIMPSISGNPLNYLSYIRSFEFKGDRLKVTLNGEMTGNHADISFEITTNNGVLSTLNIINLCTNAAENEYSNIQIRLNEYRGITPQESEKSRFVDTTDANFIDISGSAQLLKAFINTSNLTDFNITSTLKINANIIGIDINMDVNVYIKVKMINGKPTIIIDIKDIPVITGVNYDSYEAPDSVLQLPKNRNLSIYIENGMAYIYRSEKISRYLSYYDYQKCVMVHTSEFLGNFTYYLLEYGFGFSSNIMKEINAAMQKAQNRTEPINLGNILKGFSAKGDVQTIIINLAEIANNSQLGNAELNFTIGRDGAIGEYLSKLTFNIHMPLANVCTINISTNNMTLNNVGAAVDVSGEQNYMNNYAFGEGIEMVNRNSGSFSIDSVKTYTITFDSQGGDAVSPITAEIGAQINIPQLGNRIVVDSANRIKYLYEFSGWYLSDNFEEATRFNETTMPRGGAYLYAKWVLIKTTHAYKVTFVTNGGSAVNEIWVDEGESISNIPSSSRARTGAGGEYNWKKVKYLWTLTDYTFAGWFFESGLSTQYTNQKIVGNITLYAKWNTNTWQTYVGYSIHKEYQKGNFYA